MHLSGCHQVRAILLAHSAVRNKTIAEYFVVVVVVAAVVAVILSSAAERTTERNSGIAIQLAVADTPLEWVVCMQSVV